MTRMIRSDSGISLSPLPTRALGPQVSVPLSDQVYTFGVGRRTIETVQGFTGEGLSYAVAAPFGVTIDPTSGVISVPLAHAISGEVTVTASDAESSVSSSFQLKVSQLKSIGALTPSRSAPLPFPAPDGLYHGGTLRVADDLLTIEPGTRPVADVADIAGTPLDVVAGRCDVTTDVEFDRAFLRPMTALDGTTVYARGNDFTRKTITALSVDTGVRIETAPDATIDGIFFTGGGRNVTTAVYAQLRAWPTTHDCIRYGSGHFENHVIEDSRLRHGYGAGNENLTGAQYPEYTKVRHVRTATTVTTTYEINWQDPTATSGQVFVFANGTGNAWFAIGDESATAVVGATAGDASYIDPNASYERVIGLDPRVDSHFAIVTDVGTTEIDLSAEIGLAHYLGDGITAGGGATFHNFTVRRCFFEDLCNAVAINGGKGELIRFELEFWRIYQDWMKVGGANQIGPMYTARILGDVPMALGGISDPHADSADPHADIDQMFSSAFAPGGFKDVFIADITVLPNVRSSSAYAQGVFGGTQGIEGYANVWAIGVTFPFSTTRGLSLGYKTPDQGSCWLYAYGNTFAGADFASDGNIYVYDNETTGHSYLGSNLAANRIHDPGRLQLVEENNAYFGSAKDPAAVFPHWADRLTALSREELVAAMTPTGIYAGKGVDTLALAIDRTTDDPKQVIRWANLPPGIAWETVKSAHANATYTFDAKKVMAGPAVMDVVPGLGTQVQILDGDTGDKASGWTSQTTTMQRGQFLQKRIRTGAADATVTAAVTVNGFLISTHVTSANDVFFTTDDDSGARTPVHFVDPDPMGAHIQAIEFRMKLNIPSIVANMTFATISGNQLYIEHLVTAMRVRVRDDTGTSILVATVKDAKGDNVVFPTGLPAELFALIDLPNRVVRITIDGVTHPDLTLDANSGFFDSTRVAALLVEFDGTDHLPAGTVVEYAEVYKDAGHGMMLHKPIVGLPAEINDPAETWHQGQDAV